MKYALHARCDKQYLLLADEIIVDYKERMRILDYPEQYPKAAVTIQCYDENVGDIDWTWLKGLSKQFPNFSVGVIDTATLQFGLSLKLKMYLLKHINNFAELNTLYELGVNYLYVDQPLFSSCDKLKNFNIPIRWTPTLVDSSKGYLSRLIHGTWIRPEDLDQYDIIPGCITEFDRSINGNRQEQSYYKFYAQKKEFPSGVQFLWPALDGLYDTDNWLLDNELVTYRMNCHQKCEEVPNGQGCHICDKAFLIANAEKVKQYINEAIKPQQQSQD